MMTPMAEHPALRLPRRIVQPIVAVLLSMILALATIVATLRSLPTRGFDAVNFYIPMAEGQTFLKPFGSRILFPATVRALHLITQISLDNGFLAMGAATVFGLLFFTSSTLRRYGVSTVVIVITLFSPLLLNLFQNYYLTELFYAGLTALFIYMLARGWRWLSLPVLFLMVFTRQEALVLGAVTVGIAWLRHERRFAIGALASVGVADFILGRLVPQGNIHGISDAVYGVAKIAKGIFNNFFGMETWTDTYTGFCSHPAFTFGLPGGMHLGGIHAFGLCPFDPLTPVTTLLNFVTLFGIAPMLVAALIWKGRRPLLAKQPTWLLIALAYGVIVFLTELNWRAEGSFPRQVAYAWPAFWFAAPLLVTQARLDRSRGKWVLLTCQLATLWLPRLFIPDSLTVDAFVLLGAILVNVVAYKAAFADSWRPSREGDVGRRIDVGKGWFPP